jgi:Clp amino terminal domain, pathogenicity island component
MAEFPVPLDNLIAYVKTLHSDGGPLENVADAFAVSEQLDEQSDALLGYFVDQARRSGLPWSQIGAAMGVSKQAAQKRFVPGQESILLREIGASQTGRQPFSRFTDRAIRVLFAAGHLAADHLAAGQAKAAERAKAAEGAEGAEGGASAEPSPIGATQLAAAFLSEPEGLAAKAIRAAGLTPEQVYAALGTGPAPQLPNPDRAALRELTFDDSAKAAFKEALKWALRMGHNYIGTEHLLLGVMFIGGPAAEEFTALSLSPQRAEELITAELSAYQANLQGQLTAMGRNRPMPEPSAPGGRGGPGGSGELSPSGHLFALPCSGQQRRALAAQREVSPMYIGIGTVVVIVIIVLIVLALRR